jgi:hypothetical protein
MSIPSIHLGACPQRPAGGPVEGAYVTSAGERFYRIRHVDAMPPFLMSVVGASDLWMFVSSSGGLTAGRVDADGALFPYTTVDKLTEGYDHTGPKTVFRVTRNGRTSLWEPFSERGHGIYRVERSLDKSVLGHEVRFHEINHDLGLGFSYAWRGSDAYGFVRTSSLTELASAPCAVELLDGLQNLVPAGATAAMQGGLSNLLDAYKRNELEPSTGLGLYALSSTLTDLAEPSESLLATTVFALGLAGAGRLLSSVQLERFRRGGTPVGETDVRGRRGAYFVHADLTLSPGETRSWHLVADVGRDHAQVVALSNALRAGEGGLESLVEADVQRSGEALAAIVASADGFQWTRDPLAADHHLASVLFNVMRGGVFLDHDLVPRADLIHFVRTRNRALLETHGAFFDGLPPSLPRRALVERAAEEGAPDLERVCGAYLPLAFSRRHGDPSRPWNRFTINVRHADGRPRLDYQGNWRDIFQNWEALAHAFPGFVTGMIGVFLGATTADGYNPYRVTRDGIEWEAPEPGHPWSNIGYWSDHQVVYLQKLLETAARFDPGALDALLDRRTFSHANVPYRIRPYESMLDDPYDTIAFDADLDRRIEAAVATEGTDARLLKGPDGAVLHVSMAEKLLLLLLVKLANLVPEGGIWMNTQRPEWNDANNALVGKGLSVVTTAYLYGYVVFLQELLADRPTVGLTRELRSFFDAVHAGLRAHAGRLDASFDDRHRRAFMDTLGTAGSAYRRDLYERGVSGAWTELDGATLTAFLELAQAYLERTLRANRRPDALYHAYNVLALEGGRAEIRRLDEMLEGQVAILSSGLLSAAEALDLLASLRGGRLYRADQHSYVLYPDRDLPGFLAKNRIPPERVHASALLSALVERGDARVVVRDADGDVRFHGSFRNAKSVRRALAELGREDAWAALVAAEGEGIALLFEETFDHASFTGRSGTFFAYEGLGSIYWHMVSKLLLAVQGCYRRALEAGEPPELVAALAAAYDDVRAGLGFHKTPAEFGAFPTDPYSHTPAHAGAQQPGMTGQVKEDVLARLGELGVEVQGGRLGFAPSLLTRAEFLDEPLEVTVRGIGGPVDLALQSGTLAFTFCQVPVVYRLADGAAPVAVERRDGVVKTGAGAFLDAETSREVFERTGAVTRIEVTVPVSALRSLEETEPARSGVDRGAIHARSASEPAAPSAGWVERP